MVAAITVEDMPETCTANTPTICALQLANTMCCELRFRRPGVLEILLRQKQVVFSGHLLGARRTPMKATATKPRPQERRYVQTHMRRADSPQLTFAYCFKNYSE